MANHSLSDLFKREIDAWNRSTLRYQLEELERTSLDGIARSARSALASSWELERQRNTVSFLQAEGARLRPDTHWLQTMTERLIADARRLPYMDDIQPLQSVQQQILKDLNASIGLLPSAVESLLAESQSWSQSLKSASGLSETVDQLMQRAFGHRWISEHPYAQGHDGEAPATFSTDANGEDRAPPTALIDHLPPTSPEGVLERLLDFVQSLSPVQKIIIFPVVFQLLALVKDVMLVILAPIANHYVGRWLEDSPQGNVKRAQAEVIEQAGGAAILRDFRLVVTPDMAVREVPAAASKVVAWIGFGATVRVLEFRGAFALIEWKAEGDHRHTGWVFTRYLKRFPAS